MWTKAAAGIAVAGVVACAHKPGVREGDVGANDDPLLARLEINVDARQRIDEPLEIVVGLSIPGASGASCLTIPDDLGVQLDGQRAELTYRGGAARPTPISGVAVQLTECAPAQFRWRASASYTPSPSTRITIERGSRAAEIEIAKLTMPRTLRVVAPAGPLHPGEPVTLEWSPHDDEWSGYPSAPEVHIYEPDDFSVRAPVEVEQPRFRFAMPAVRPGRARIDLYYLYLRPHPQIRRCSGLRRCTATVHTGPRTIEVEIGDAASQALARSVSP